jgi:nucleotide-binding universal stress UspA family protein
MAMHRRTVLLTLVSSPLLALAQRRPVLRVSVLAEGVVIVNDSLTNLPQLEAMLAELKSNHGIVWYYREGQQGQANAVATEVAKLLQKHELPISVSTRPDFSDYVDASGKSWPRPK